MEPHSYEIGRVPRTLVGVGSLGALRSAVESLANFASADFARGSRTVVLIVDGVVATGGYLDRVVGALGSMDHTVHIAPQGEPTVGSVDAAAAVVRATPDAVVIGIGGGSALDIAKQAATVGVGTEGVEPYLLCANPLPGRRPIVAIPTTSGTGAEVTRTCIVSDRNGRKMWTWGDEMLPDVVVLDPMAAVTMPHGVTVGTGLDAFVHALEACTSIRRSSVASASAQRALRLVTDHLPRAAADGTDLAARQAMQEAAFLAGMAIDNCGTGVAHSIGHALGTLYHVPHGIAVAVGLRAALDWNVEGSPDAFVDAADALGCPIDGVPDALAALFEQTHVAQVVRGTSLGSFDAAAVADMMMAPENQPMLQNNARTVDDGARVMLAERTVGLWDELTTGLSP